MMKNKVQKKDSLALEYEISSGNIFADLGVAHPEEALAKSQLALQINDVIAQKKLTQRSAAKLLGIDQPKISALMNGKLTGFSLERLFRFLNDLGQDVTISVKPRKSLKTKAKLYVDLPKLDQVERSKLTR